MKAETQGDAGIKSGILVPGAFILSVYFVIAVWNFWSEFIDALGFNMTVFILGMVALFLFSIGKTTLKNHYSWLIPIFFISVSFTLWENPFLKVINLLLLPLALSIFFNYAIQSEKKLNPTSIIFSILERIGILTKLRAAVQLVFKGLNKIEGNDQKLAYRIILGLFLFLLLALTVFIPLLSSSDPVFAQFMKGISDWFYHILSFRYMGRIVFALVAAFFIISYVLSFERRGATVAAAEQEKKMLNPVVAGIVLGGVMLLYVLFLSMQLSRLWVAQLPFDFHQTEQLVKSGFWQLFILSVINIIFFFAYYRKTNDIVQNILKIFTVASFLLLGSAGHRMFLYVFYYGLSYEKFFASYTVLYCALLFLWLAYQLFANRESNLFKFLIFSLLWMYSVATVMPVERIIFSVNASLSQRADSRIKMNELQMLSYDALPLVARYRNDVTWQEDWCSWAHWKMKRTEEKKWYEKNLANFAAVQIPQRWRQGDCAPAEEKVDPVNAPAPDNQNAPALPKDDRKIYDDTDYSFQVKYPKDGWRIIRYFDIEKNQPGGAFVYKDAKTIVSILPLGNYKNTYPNFKPVTSQITIGSLAAKKSVWQLSDGSGVISIKLSSYPETWNDKQVIEAKYTKDTKAVVEKIIDSFVINGQ